MPELTNTIGVGRGVDLIQVLDCGYSSASQAQKTPYIISDQAGPNSQSQFATCAYGAPGVPSDISSYRHTLSLQDDLFRGISYLPTYYFAKSTYSKQSVDLTT